MTSADDAGMLSVLGSILDSEVDSGENFEMDPGIDFVFDSGVDSAVV